MGSWILMMMLTTAAGPERYGQPLSLSGVEFRQRKAANPELSKC